MKRGLILAVGLVMLLAACGNGTPSASSPATPDGDWQLISGVSTVDDHPITLTIEGNLISGRAACNGYGGAAEIGMASSGDQEFMVSELSMTEMGCEQPIQQSEQEFMAALVAVTAWNLEDPQLHLTGPGIDLAFTLMTPVPAEELIGTEWILESLVQGDAVSSVAGDEATLLLDDDGTLTGSTGCRTLEGTWIITNGEVLFPNFAANGECSASLSDQDGFVVTVLGDGFRAEIEEDRLTVTSVGNEGLQYRSR